jgi:hypothetical protein
MQTHKLAPQTRWDMTGRYTTLLQLDISASEPAKRRAKAWRGMARHGAAWRELELH